MAELAGYVQRVVFNSDDFNVLNFFVVESDDPGSDRNTTVRGNIFGLTQIVRDVPIRFRGLWRRHKQYGMQFSIQSWEPWADSAEEVELFLGTCVDGFTPTMARVIARAYGTEAFTKLTEAPQEILGELSDVDPDELEGAILAWETALATRDLSSLLKKGGLDQFEVQAALAKFGTQAGAIIQDNPYRLMEVEGMWFVKVDKLAASLGVPPEHPRRIEGAVMWAVREGTKSGHLFLRRGQIPRTVIDLMTRTTLPSLHLGDDPETRFFSAAKQLVERKALILEEGLGVYLPEFYAYERLSAEMLATLLETEELEVDVEAFLEEYQRANRITLSDAQRDAVEHLAQHRVLILTGLPGTGKTTAVRALVRLFEEAKVSFALMAPTGIAAKRLSAVTGHDASTIHRALRYDGNKWLFGAHNRYVVNAVVVDEVSMVDQELLFRLLVALRPDTSLVLVGDDAQLPSVGPGNVLRELVDCKVVPNVKLTQIFRQSEKGEIVTNSHRINRGEMPSLPDPKSETEFKFLRINDEEKIADYIVRMAAKLKARNANFQVLSPKYDGVVGVNNLNNLLRDTLNPPGPAEWSYNGQHFRLGDRVMVIKNDYARNVYNGDVGKLVRIHKDGLVVKIHAIGDEPDMLVDFGPIKVGRRTVPAANGKLQLAYAVTVHKSQGSEFDTIIMPIVRSQGRMLQRNLLYTAVTRARKRVWLLGDESAIAKAIANNKVVKRNTNLAGAIESLLSGVEGDHERPAEPPQ